MESQIKRQIAAVAPHVVKRVLHRVEDAVRLGAYTRSRWPPPLGSRPATEVAICCIFRDEARYIAEWVAFHRLQGVTRFFLYDNLSADDWESELRWAIEAGIVEVTPWPIEPGQAPAYQDCLQRHRDHARWIAFIDSDEFLFSPTGRPLPDVLRQFDAHPGVVVNWRCYGLNGWEHPPEGLVIENYLRRAVDNEPNNRFVKSIVFPRHTIAPVGPHYFRFRRWASVGEDGRPVYWSTRTPVTADLLRINHYFARSSDGLHEKITRRSAWDGNIGVSGVASWRKLPEDAVEDDVLVQFAPAVKAALGRDR